MRRLAAALLIAGVFLSGIPAGVSADDSYKVVITAKGKKYHVPGCRTVKKVYKTITVEQAKKSGYKPCKVCDP